MNGAAENNPVGGLRWCLTLGKPSRRRGSARTDVQVSTRADRGPDDGVSRIARRARERLVTVARHCGKTTPPEAQASRPTLWRQPQAVSAWIGHALDLVGRGPDDGVDRTARRFCLTLGGSSAKLTLFSLLLIRHSGVPHLQNLTTMRPSNPGLGQDDVIDICGK